MLRVLFIQLEDGEESFCGNLYRTQRPHLLFEPRKIQDFAGPRYQNKTGQAEPARYKVLQSKTLVRRRRGGSHVFAEGKKKLL